MHVEVAPEDVRTIKIRSEKKTERNKKYCSIGIPPDLVNRYSLVRGDLIVVAFISKVTVKNGGNDGEDHRGP